MTFPIFLYSPRSYLVSPCALFLFDSGGLLVGWKQFSLQWCPLPKHPRSNYSLDPSSLPKVSVVIPIPRIPPQEPTPTPVQPSPGILTHPDISVPCTPSLSPGGIFLDHIDMSQLQSKTEGGSDDKAAVYAALGGYPTTAEMAAIHHIHAGTIVLETMIGQICGFPNNFVSSRTGMSFGLALLSPAGTTTLLMYLPCQAIIVAH